MSERRPAFYGILDTFNEPATLCRREYDTLCRAEVEVKARDLNEIQGRPRYAPAAVFADGRVEELKS
jgi:hypothetical protein